MSRIRIFFFLSALSALGISEAFPGSSIKLGMAGEVLIPQNDNFRELYNTGFGVSFSGHYMMTDALSLVVTSGYFAFPPDTPQGVTLENGIMIPVVGGVKLSLFPGNFSVYAAIDAGIVSVKTSQLSGSSGTAADVESISSVKSLWEPQIGLETKIGEATSLEMSARYLGISGADSFAFRAGVLFEL